MISFSQLQIYIAAPSSSEPLTWISDVMPSIEILLNNLGEQIAEYKNTTFSGNAVAFHAKAKLRRYLRETYPTLRFDVVVDVSDAPGYLTIRLKIRKPDTFPNSFITIDSYLGPWEPASLHNPCPWCVPDSLDTTGDTVVERCENCEGSGQDEVSAFSITTPVVDAEDFCTYCGEAHDDGCASDCRCEECDEE